MARPAAERWRTVRGQRHLIWTEKSLPFPLYPLLMGLLFFPGDSCDFTCLPVVLASVTQARLLSKHQWLVCGSALHFHHQKPHTHAHTHKHRFAAGSLGWTDLATVQCYGRVSPHSRIQNASFSHQSLRIQLNDRRGDMALCRARVGKTVSTHFSKPVTQLGGSFRDGNLCLILFFTLLLVVHIAHTEKPVNMWW